MAGTGQRLDKWLWHARIARTRSVAGRLVAGGKVRVNRQRVTKPAHPLHPGDVITLMLAGRVWVLRIEALAERRGPAAEARGLYADLTPETPSPPRPRGLERAAGARPAGAGRPTKRERRELEKFLARR